MANSFYWLNIQSRFDLEEEKESNVKYNQIIPFKDEALVGRERKK